MSASNRALMANLMERNNHGNITKGEMKILEALVERGDQLMLRKAEAAAIIVHRGYTGSVNELISPNDE
jgi:hypothetical protein